MKRPACSRRAGRTSCTALRPRASATGATCASRSRPGSGWRPPAPGTSSRSCPTIARSTRSATSPPASGSSSAVCPTAASRRARRTRPWRRKPGRRPRAPRARAAGAVAVVAVPADRPHRPVTVGTSSPARRRGTAPQGGQRGGRAGGVRGRPAPSHHAARPHPEPAQTTAPHDELVSVVRGLVEASPRRAVSIDSVANALKSRGFQRSPGSPRLVTRLRRIREIVVSQSGTITLADDAPPIESQPRLEVAPPVESEPTRMEEEPTAASAPIDEADDEDRQPDFLHHPDQEIGAARGGRQPRGAAVHAATAAARA